MKLFFKLPENQGILDGPPFFLLLKGKSYVKIRSVLIITIIVWIISSLMGNIFTIQEHLIFSFLSLLAIITSHDKAISISGNNGNWNIVTYKFFEFGAIEMKNTLLKDIKAEFRVVSRKKNHGALVIIKNPEDKTISSIMARNIDAKEFKDNLEIINVDINIRKRGKKGELQNENVLLVEKHD